jgi:hypothetical protein
MQSSDVRVEVVLALGLVVAPVDDALELGGFAAFVLFVSA